MKKASKFTDQVVPPKYIAAVELLKPIGSPKKSIFQQSLTDLKNLLGQNSLKKLDGFDKNKKQNSSIFQVFRYPRLCLRLVLLSLHWVAVNTLYYGLSFGAQMFKQDTHIYVLSQGLAGAAGATVGLFLLNFVGRKPSAIGILIFAGLCYLSCVFVLQISHIFSYNSSVESALILVITFSAKLSLEFLFVLCYLWTSDLMPTVIRTSGLGLAPSAARITGISLPFIGYLAYFGQAAPLLSYTALAFTVVICSLFLPESKGKLLPTTLSDGNTFGTEEDTQNRG